MIKEKKWKFEDVSSIEVSANEDLLENLKESLQKENPHWVEADFQISPDRTTLFYPRGRVKRLDGKPLDGAETFSFTKALYELMKRFINENFQK
jgi:hypothetical protein